MVVLGGIGHIPGVVMGGVLLAALPEVLRHVVEPAQQALFGKVVIEAEVLRQLLYGLAMVVIMLYRPAGLWPSPRKEDRPAAAHAKDEHEENEEKRDEKREAEKT
jgi:branched-chain amino acid transport system permease protein